VLQIYFLLLEYIDFFGVAIYAELTMVGFRRKSMDSYELPRPVGCPKLRYKAVLKRDLKALK